MPEILYINIVKYCMEVLNMKKALSVIMVIAVIAVTACFVFPAIASDTPDTAENTSSHMFCLSSYTSDNWFVYQCSDEGCSASITKSPSEVLKIWGTDYINTAPSDTSVNDSCYLDLDCSGVINARDYAMLKQACRNEIPGDDNDVVWGD